MKKYTLVVPLTIDGKEISEVLFDPILRTGAVEEMEEFALLDEYGNVTKNHIKASRISLQNALDWSEENTKKLALVDLMEMTLLIQKDPNLQKISDKKKPMESQKKTQILEKKYQLEN